MAKPGFGVTYVEDQGFLSLKETLLTGAGWKDIDVSAYYNPDKKLSASLLDASVLAQNKVRLLLAIDELLAAKTTETREVADDNWDGSQDALFHGTAVFRKSQDPQRRAAALRMLANKNIFKGKGTGQTQLGLQAEVDFAWQQLAILRKAPHSDDVTTLGLEPLVAEIEQMTKQLAALLGHAEGGDIPDRGALRLNALRSCRQAFNAAQDNIDWYRTQPTTPTERRAQLDVLLASLHSLLERYPAAPASTAVNDAPKEA
jgi:hypothetical protein